MSGIFFAHPHTLLDQVGKVLERVGPENFFKSSNEELKKTREGFAAYFFTLALKKYYGGRDWWLTQYDQAVRAYPDFDFISFAENPDDLKMEPMELTGIHPNFKSFDETLEVIRLVMFFNF